MDYVRQWSEKTELPATRLVGWIGVSRSKFSDWKDRYGKVNEHNAWIRRDHWLQDWEEQAIVNFYQAHPEDGYRRLTYMMIDADIVAVSPSSVYRVLRNGGYLARWNRTLSKKGTGFQQPTRPHEHWHVDMAHINVCGTFFYLLTILDGYSRYIIHWEIRESMTERDVETILQRAREKFPNEHPRIISDNGPQFIAREFDQYIRLCGMTHVRTSPYYPQSNGKIERFTETLRAEGLRPGSPLSLEDARRVVGRFIERYNAVRLHSAIQYIAPKDKLEGRAQAILAARESKLTAARERRRIRREQERNSGHLTNRREQERNTGHLTNRKEARILPSAGETEASSAGAQFARDSRSVGDECLNGGVFQGSPSHLAVTIQTDIPSLPHALENSSPFGTGKSLNRVGDLSNSR